MRPPLLPLLLLSLPLSACPPVLDGDDDSASDDDDATSDDDDATSDDDDATSDDDDATSDDDDATSDDDDATSDDDDSAGGECPSDLAAAIADVGSWALQTSCGAAFFSVASPGETTRLAIQFDLMTAPALAVGSTYRLVFDGNVQSKDMVQGSLGVQRGQNLLAYDCTDVVELAPVIDLQLDGIEGEALLEVRSYSDAMTWTGDITLQGVVVQDGQGLRCPVPDTTWTDLYLGWLPG